MQNEREKSNKPLIFDNIVIRLSQQMHNNEPITFEAEVRQTPTPLQGGAFRIKSDEQLKEFHHLFTGQVNLNHFFYDYTSPPDKSDGELEQTASDLAELGDKLYELLPVSLSDGLPRLIEEVFEQGRGIRLIIEASARDKADRLLSLPWELLLIEVNPINLPRLLVVRRLLDAARHSPVELKAPFDLVHVIADDPEQKIEADLQQMERDTIPAAIAPGTCVSIEKPGSVEKLLTCLDKQSTQILHFLGHGEAPSEDKRSFAARGYLCFINQAGKRQWVTGERLQHLLGGTLGLQLIVLNACDSASVVTANVALDLVYSGFPYVVAMQAKMPQEAAKHFIRAFYSQLQKGQNIEYAVAAGRFEIAAQLPGAIDWCLPVLYTNVGLAERRPILERAIYLSQRVKEENDILPICLALGLLHLTIGGLLWLSGASPPLPDSDFMLWATGWLVGVPPFLAAWIYKQLPVPNDWPRSTYLALLSHLTGMAAIFIGSFIFILIWFSVVLFVALGFWGSLSPLAHILLLIPLMLVSIWLSYGFTHRDGLRFVTSAQIANQLPWFEQYFVTSLFGYVMLLGIFYFSYFQKDLYTPPLGNLFIGVVVSGVGYFLHHQLPVWRNRPEMPFNDSPS